MISATAIEPGLSLPPPSSAVASGAASPRTPPAAWFEVNEGPTGPPPEAAVWLVSGAPSSNSHAMVSARLRVVKAAPSSPWSRRPQNTANLSIYREGFYVQSLQPWELVTPGARANA